MKGKSLLTVVLLVAGFLAAGFPSFAQDIITKKDGTDIKAKVLEVNESEVKYRRYDYLDGPIFTMLKSEILIVRYENGTNDVFNGKVKYVPVVKSEPEPTVEDVEDRDREDVKKEKKDSKKDSKKSSKKDAKKESKKDVKKKDKKTSEDEEEVVVEEKEEKVEKEGKVEKEKKDSKKESSKKESKKDVKKKKDSKDEEEVVAEEKEEVEKDAKKEEKEKKEKKDKKDSKKDKEKKEKDSSKKDKDKDKDKDKKSDKGGSKAVDGIEILSGDTYFLTKSDEAVVVFDYDKTVVEGKPLMEYLKGQGSDWVEEWPENQEFISGKFVEYFNDKSKGMTLVEKGKAPYRLVIHVDKMDFGSVAGNPFNMYSGGAEISGTVEVVDASSGKKCLSMDFTDIQGVRQMSATWRLEFAFIELAKRLLKFSK